MTRKFKLNHNQLPLPFGDKAAKALSLDDRQRFFWFLVSVSALSLLVYIYSINAAAHHIAVRQNLEREVSDTNVRLSALEFEVIQEKNNITLETAQQYGFVEVKEPLYVSREATNSLTLNTVTR
jgi:hypothetical protein